MSEYLVSWLRTIVFVDRLHDGPRDADGYAWGVNVYSVLVAEWSTRREAERHASRIRRALKGGE